MVNGKQVLGLAYGGVIWTVQTSPTPTMIVGAKWGEGLCGGRFLREVSSAY